MKNFWKLLCGLCVCVTLTACSGNKIDEAALTALDDAAAKMGEWNSFGYEANIDAATNGEKMVMKLYGGAIMPKEDALLPNMSMTADMSVQGISMEEFMEMYFYENTLYMSIMGEKQKMPLDSGIFSLYKEATESRKKINVTMDVLKPYLESASKYGNVIRLEFDTEKMEEEVSGTTGASEFRSFVWETNLAEDGSVHSFVFHIEAEEEKAGSGETIIMDIDFQFKDVNKIDSLTLPDFSDYKESSEPIF